MHTNGSYLVFVPSRWRRMFRGSLILFCRRRFRRRWCFRGLFLRMSRGGRLRTLRGALRVRWMIDIVDFITASIVLRRLDLLTTAAVFLLLLLLLPALLVVNRGVDFRFGLVFSGPDPRNWIRFLVILLVNLLPLRLRLGFRRFSPEGKGRNNRSFARLKKQLIRGRSLHSRDSSLEECRRPQERARRTEIMTIAATDHSWRVVTPLSPRNGNRLQLRLTDQRQDEGDKD